MSEKHIKKVIVLFFSVLLFFILSACNSSPEGIPQTQSENNLSTPSEIASPSDLIFQEGLLKIKSELGSNATEIKLNPEEFKYLENPIGEGIFIYEPETQFFEIERYFIWVCINNNIYVVNGATKDVTPNVLWAREAPPEVWAQTNISQNSAVDLIGYIFEGKNLNPSEETLRATNTPYHEILFGYNTEERKQIFYKIVEAEDKAFLENKESSFYHQEVADLYGILLEQLDLIGEEGILNHWPMPPSTQ